MSGFMVMNLARMRDDNLVARFLEVIAAFRDRLKFFDLDVLNLSCDAILPLPFEYVTLEDVYESDDVTRSGDYPFLATIYTVGELERAKRTPAIIHYAGRRGKPWQRRDVPAYFQHYVDRLPAALRVTTFRDFRKRLSARGSGGR
jgi:lipopolysaccharide biosynthesis glycosyltransferase